MSERSGFTLIELILVTVIIGILASMVTLSFHGRTEEARITRAKADIRVYQDAVDLYALDHNDKFPKSLDQLVNGDRKYVRKLERDPWKNPYIYKLPGKHDAYDILSRGPDGIEGNADDITSWQVD